MSAGDFRGILTATSFALPVGIDGNRVATWRLRDGVTYQEVKSLIAAALDDYNAELLTTYGDLITVGDYDYFEYPNGGALSDVQQGTTDGSRGDVAKVVMTGHSVDLKWYQEGIAGDIRFWRDTRKSVILGQTRMVTQKFRNLWERKILGRFFTSSETLLGTNGWDVPFANANPNKNSGGVDFIPFEYGGQSFDDTHNHYQYVNGTVSATTVDTAIINLAQTVNEHGFNGPYTAYVSGFDVDSYRLAKSYIQPVNTINMIDRGGLTSGNIYYENGVIGAVPSLGGRYIGGYDTGYGVVGLYATYRLPTGYLGLYKSFGQLDARNAIAVRIHPSFGFGAKVMEVPSYDTTWPVKEVNLQFEFAAGCGVNRTLGAASYIHSGASVYVDPTLT